MVDGAHQNTKILRAKFCRVAKWLTKYISKSDHTNLEMCIWFWHRWLLCIEHGIQMRTIHSHGNHRIQKSKISYANAHWAKGLANELFCCYASRKHITMHQVRTSCLCKFWNCTLAMMWSARLPSTKLCYQATQSRKSKFHQCKVFELSCSKTMKINNGESMHSPTTTEILTCPESKGPANVLNANQNCIHHEPDTPQCQRLPKSIWR